MPDHAGTDMQADDVAGRSVGPGGRVVAGRYRLDRLLGRGGMGAVWAARDDVLRRPVAVKEVQPSLALTPEQQDEIRRRTMREARAAARIAHPSVVRIYDVVEDDGRPWIVMELLDAHTLAELLAAGPLTPLAVSRLGLQLADALRTAHDAGVLHRDIKPANVMVFSTGRAVLTDFGIATVDEDTTLTATGMVLGSPPYMSPERARGERPAPASDVWSLGATLFAAVEGTPPFQRDGQLQTLHAVVNEIPPHPAHAGPLAPVIERLLDRDPALRPSAAEAHELLREASGVFAGRHGVPASTEPGGKEGEVSPAPPGSGPVTALRAEHVRGNRRNAVLAAAAALVVVAAISALLGLQSQERDLSGSGSSSSPSTPAATAAKSRAGETPATDSSSTERTAAARSPETTTSTSGPSGGDVVPAGFRLHSDSTGFRIAVPRGWTRSVRGTSTFFRDPSGPSYLQVDQTTRPKPDALEDWQAQEASVASRLRGYQRIRLERVDYRGWNAADWEFTWQAKSGRLHVVNRNVRVSARQAYALLWSVPDRQWASRWRDFQQVARSFDPA